MSAPIQLFRHCPACGMSLTALNHGTVVSCDLCGFPYHFLFFVGQVSGVTTPTPLEEVDTVHWIDP